LRLRTASRILRRFPAFNVSHNGNLFRSYFHVVVYTNKTINNGSRVAYLVKNYKPCGSAVLHNVFGEDIVVARRDRGVRRVLAFRWVRHIENSVLSILKSLQ